MEIIVLDLQNSIPSLSVLEFHGALRATETVNCQCNKVILHLSVKSPKG